MSSWVQRGHWTFLPAAFSGALKVFWQVGQANRITGRYQPGYESPEMIPACGNSKLRLTMQASVG